LLLYKGICTLSRIESVAMPMVTTPEECNCFTVRAAARHITQVYDQLLAQAGLRKTQFSILAKLKRLGPLTNGRGLVLPSIPTLRHHFQ
jgi:hypothetical protein